MPLYEFKCRECEHTFELRQAWKDPFPTCPECHGEVKKIFHAAALVFKGSGWHINDYAKSGGANGSNGSKVAEAAEKAEKASETAASTSSSSGSSESSSASGGSKPEAKTAT